MPRVMGNSREGEKPPSNLFNRLNGSGRHEQAESHPHEPDKRWKTCESAHCWSRKPEHIGECRQLAAAAAMCGTHHFSRFDILERGPCTRCQKSAAFRRVDRKRAHVPGRRPGGAGARDEPDRRRQCMPTTMRRPAATCSGGQTGIVPGSSHVSFGSPSAPHSAYG